VQDAIEDLGRYIIDGIQRRVTRSISYRLAQDAAALKDLSSKIVPAAIQKPVCTFKRFERSAKTRYETCPAQVPYPNPEKVKCKGKESLYNNCGLIGHVRKDCPNHNYRKCHQIDHNASECTATPVPKRCPARNRPKGSQRLEKMLPPTQLIQRHDRARPTEIGWPSMVYQSLSRYVMCTW